MKPVNSDQTPTGHSLPVAKAKLGDFVQEKPVLHNPYTTDGPLKRYLQRLLPAEVFKFVSSDLTRFGDRIVEEIDEIGRQCELNPPYLKTFDAWGRRVDNLVTSDAWKRMKVISAEEGLVACGYENRFGEFDRLYQFAKLYLFAPSSGLYNCPLAMTDGAAKVIKELNLNDGEMTAVYDRLTTRNPDKMWTSGQWMTEKKGGSDVATGTDTVAIPRPDGGYTLHGYKWFSSATDADMSITLARPMAGDGSTVDGTRGLSLFYLPVREPGSKQLNNIEIVRLKDKLGTRQLPTAELLLDGSVAKKISDDGRGVASIANMLNITRIYNATSGTAGMRRIIALSRDYMCRRKAFGKYLSEHPLHVQTVASLALLLDVARLLGLQETKKMSNSENLLLRLLTPLLKLHNGKVVIPLISEGLESFGGMGYLEDTGLPRALRDAQVLPIWEGTTNILSLDVLRHLSKEGHKVLEAYQTEIRLKTDKALRKNGLKNSVVTVRQCVQSALQFAARNASNLQMAARDFSISLARCYIGALLLEHASSAVATEDDLETAIRWCQFSGNMVHLRPDESYSPSSIADDKSLLFDSYPKAKSKL